MGPQYSPGTPHSPTSGAQVIASTLDTRDAFDAKLAAGMLSLHLRSDDAAGQAKMQSCLAGGASPAECTAVVESSIDSRGFFCPTTLRIDASGRTCVADTAPSPAKAAALLKEAEAKAGPVPSNVPLIVGGVAVAGLLAWWLLR